MNQYGPAIVLGIFIGGAILFDDYVRPHPPMSPMMVEAIEMGDMPFIAEDIHEFHMAPDGDTKSKVWMMLSRCCSMHHQWVNVFGMLIFQRVH